jgi:hypothetical protein
MVDRIIDAATPSIERTNLRPDRSREERGRGRKRSARTFQHPLRFIRDETVRTIDP